MKKTDAPTVKPTGRYPPGTRFVEIDIAEMACRLMEAMFPGNQRPSGVTAKQALGMLPEGVRADIMRAADAGARYIRDCVSAAEGPTGRAH